MKNVFGFLVILILIISCSAHNRKQTGKAVSELNSKDTLILQKNVTGEIAGSAYSKKAISYVTVLNNDTSGFSPVFIESNENGAVSIDLNLPYTNKTESWAQRLRELKLILPESAKEFNLGSLNSISVGRLILTGDLSIEITEKYKIRFGENVRIKTSDYGKISNFLLETQLTDDMNELFKPYSVSVAKITIEKAFFTTKNELLNNSSVERDPSEIPDKILDCIVWIRFKNK